MSKTEKSLLEHHSNNYCRQFPPKLDAKISDQMFEEKLDVYIFLKYHLQDFNEKEKHREFIVEKPCKN